MSLIALPGFMYLSNELNMTLYYYSYNLQPYTVVFLVEADTNILNFAPKYGCGDLSIVPNRDRLIARAPQLLFLLLAGAHQYRRCAGAAPLVAPPLLMATLCPPCAAQVRRRLTSVAPTARYCLSPWSPDRACPPYCNGLRPAATGCVSPNMATVSSCSVHVDKSCGAKSTVAFI